LQGDHVAFAEDDGVLTLTPEALGGILQAVLKRGDAVRFKARGLSMHPLIRDGDVLTVTPLPRGSVRVGDVVACQRPADDSVLVHRVVLIRPGGVVTRGDAVRQADGFIPVRDVLGRVSRVERDGRAVWTGGSCERWLVAALSRRGCLLPLVTRQRSVRTALRRLASSLDCLTRGREHVGR
jgi:hypothetical protein